MQRNDTVVITRHVPMGIGSVFGLRPGDEVLLVRVGERDCAVEMFGTTIVVPRDCLISRSGTSERPGASDDLDELADDWWKD